MKRLVIFMFIAVLIIGTVSAQNRNNRPDANNRQREVTPVSIDGNLKLERGIVAVQSGDSVYLVPLLNRYINFINDLKEGAKVSVEGNVFRRVIMPNKVTIEGKSYDFIARGFDYRNPELRNKNFGHRYNNFGPGRNNVPNPGTKPGNRERNKQTG